MDSIQVLTIAFILVFVFISLFYYLKKVRKERVREKIISLHEDILMAHDELNNILDTDCYVTQRELDGWVRRWTFLSSYLNDYFKYDLGIIDLDYEIKSIYRVFCKKNDFLRKRNNEFIEHETVKFQEYFSSMERYPLTKSQIQSIITDEYRNLVIAGAGTGKTSTIVGKLGYITQKGLVSPDEVLLLAFARDAMREMRGRVKTRLGIDIDVETFHSLGLRIISEVEGVKRSVSTLSTDKLKLQKRIEKYIEEYFSDELFFKSVNDFFLYHSYPYKSIFEFKTFGEYIDYLKQYEIRSLKGDLVKSFEECEIANFLYVNGVKYEYEKEYEVRTASRRYRQYKPDFYLIDYGIYIEHFAIDEKGNAPAFVRDRYVEDMRWKKKLHHAHNTELIETYSYEKAQGALLSNLEQKLREHNVGLQRLPEDQIFDDINRLGYVNSLAILLSTFLNLYKSSNMTVTDLKEKAGTLPFKERCKSFINIFSRIYDAYTEDLQSSGEIDFNDMISRAEKYVKNGWFQSPYRYVLVDEFQDISQSRYRLLKALLTQHQDCKLFCVGDDWQSIYRFTGSDLSIMTNFQDYFGYPEPLYLDTTFRFNDRIAHFSSRFILQNPNQIKKELKTIEKKKKPAVTILFTESTSQSLNDLLREINSKTKTSSEIYIIGRYNYQVPDNLDALRQKFPKLSIRYITAHSSKGREADYAIIIGLTSGTYGFPCQIRDDPILNLVLARKDEYPNSEERRLFYVAVTRAKQEAYLLTDTESPSPFISEIVNGHYDVKVIGKNTDELRCPVCNRGHLKLIDGYYGAFYSCSNYPYCDYRSETCPKCSVGLLYKTDTLNYECNNDSCDFTACVCPRCNEGYLTPRHGQYGRFMGCTNYPKCKYTKSR